MKLNDSNQTLVNPLLIVTLYKSKLDLGGPRIIINTSGCLFYDDMKVRDADYAALESRVVAASIRSKR